MIITCSSRYMVHTEIFLYVPLLSSLIIHFTNRYAINRRNQNHKRKIINRTSLHWW